MAFLAQSPKMVLIESPELRAAIYHHAEDDFFTEKSGFYLLSSRERDKPLLSKDFCFSHASSKKKKNNSKSDCPRKKTI